jgi:mono/diheme cytochrome c family protein
MLKSLLLTALAAGLTASLGYADQSTSKVVIPVNKTSPTSGKQMYGSYCAPCHGVDGKGSGPAAIALKMQPTDLTVLSRNHHGKFPDTHIVSVLRFGSELPAHGSSDMPVWGPILGNLDHSNDQARQLRISNLSHYVQSLQAK